MSYQTGTPASLTALMNDLKTFATTYGGFTDTGSGYTASSYTYFSLTSSGGRMVNFAYKDAGGGGDCLMNTSTAWAGSGLLTAQTGACSVNARAWFGLTPIEYWMFSDGSSVHCVVEFRAGAYAHMSFGVLEKYGTYTGGEYVSANGWHSSNTDWSSSFQARHFDGYSANNSTYKNHIRCTYNTRDIAVFCDTGVTSTNHVRNLWMSGGQYASSANDGELWRHQPNSYNSRAQLIPVELFLAYDTASLSAPTGWIPIGRVSNAALINLSDINAEDLVNTDWMVFPLCMKNPTAPSISSGEVDTVNLGFAYQK